MANGGLILLRQNGSRQVAFDTDPVYLPSAVQGPATRCDRAAGSRTSRVAAAPSRPAAPSPTAGPRTSRVAAAGRRPAAKSSTAG